MDMGREDLIEYLSDVFLQKIMQELDTLDIAGLPVDKHVLENFSVFLKKEMSYQTILADGEIIDEAIDQAFNEVVRLRQPKH
jgi:hypothetical protein